MFEFFKYCTIFQIIDLATEKDQVTESELVLVCSIAFFVSVRVHLFSTHAKFFENYHFLPLDTHTYVCVSGDKNFYFFGKFCFRTKWMIPNDSATLCKNCSLILRTKSSSRFLWNVFFGNAPVSLSNTTPLRLNFQEFRYRLENFIFLSKWLFLTFSLKQSSGLLVLFFLLLFISS